ncbi:MAG: DUF2147 domain-containing protein [Bacteroidales bacterium]
MMKNSIIFTVFLLMAAGVAAQEFTSSDILGKWENEEKDAHVKIYKEDGKFFGRIVWLKEPMEPETGKPKLDDENPDEALQSRPIEGLLILKDFIWDADDVEWDDGTIYDPKNGKTYDCYMRLDSKEALRIRGYIGFSLLGRTTYWTRVE